MLFGKSILAIIPVRLGSKRLKYKNFRIFKGKPLFMNTVILAKKSKLIDKIIITSENKKTLLKLYKEKNVFFRLRPKIFASDTTKASEVIMDVLDNEKKEYDYFIYLQPTSPLRNIFDIENCLKKVIYKKKISLISVNEKTFMPNGAVYVSKVDHYKKTKLFKNDLFSNYKMPKNRSVDIDYIADFEKAKRINFN
jgi:CMP-N-acetylneuraminic acid synthetase